MASIQQQKINKAIRDCLKFCYQSGDILPKMAEFLSTLRATTGWREAEIYEVEVAVRKLLCSIVDGATYAGDATNNPDSDGGPGDSKSPKVNGI